VALIQTARLLHRGNVHNDSYLDYYLYYDESDYLNDVCNVRIRLSTARVVDDVTRGVKVNQSPLTVRNVV